MSEGEDKDLQDKIVEQLRKRYGNFRIEESPTHVTVHIPRGDLVRFMMPFLVDALNDWLVKATRSLAERKKAGEA